MSISTLPVQNVEAQEENTWTSLAPMQERRVDLGVAEVDGKIYAIGNGPNHPIDTVEEYDPQTDTWTYKKSAPEPLDHLRVTVHHGKIYCFSGETGKTYAYTPLYDTWEKKASLPNTSDNVVANTLNDKIFVIDGTKKILNVYNPFKDTWSTKASILFELDFRDITSVILDGKIHVFGAYPIENSHQIYDPTSDKWNLAEPLIYGYVNPVVGVTSGVNAPKRIYVFGVNNRFWGDSATLTGQSYNPNTNSWTECALLPNGQLGGGAVNIEDQLYVIGGSTPFIGGQSFSSSYNSLYTPIDYGTPDPSYTPPLPTPTPTQPLEPFPTTLVLASVIIIIVGLGILVYFKKRRS